MSYFFKNGYAYSYIQSCPEPEPTNEWGLAPDWEDRLKEVCKKVISPEEYEEWLKKSSKPVPEDCLMQKHFEEEMKKPSGQRSYYAYLSCKCSRCNPGKL